jgi:hypothetical protein
MDLPVFPQGTRVRVRQDPDHAPGPWPAEPTGTIIQDCQDVEGARQTLRMYWVRFDEPQLDPDGDGPYEISQVAHIYLERFPEH